MVAGCRRPNEAVAGLSEQKFEATTIHPHRSAGQAACRRAQRKPDTPTQVNDTPRAFSKGHMGLKQKMATTQQARWAYSCALPDRPTPFRPRAVRPRPCSQQACATGEKLKCAQHKPPEQADLQVRNPIAEPQLSSIYQPVYLPTCLSNYRSITPRYLPAAPSACISA